MNHYEEQFKRTELKYLGVFLFDGELPGDYIYTHDETQEELLGSIETELDDCLKGVGQDQTKQIMDVVNALGGANERIGFYSGLRVGARLLLNLLSGSELIF